MRIIFKSMIFLGLVTIPSLMLFAADVVQHANQTVSGRITQMTKTEVVIETTGGARTIPVNQIQNITWDGEPATLKNVRMAMQVSQYEDVISALDRIKMDAITRAEIRQDVEFYRAAATAYLALRGSGSIDDAGKLVATFALNYPNNYHYWEATKLVADLLVAKGAIDKAVEYYGQLTQAPWPEFKAQAGTAIGWAYLGTGKVDDAEKAFSEVIALQISGDDTPKVLASIGKARCLAEKGQTQEAVAMIQDVLKRPDLMENAEVMGRAYVALGLAYRKAGDAKRAIMAFLHTDLLYFRHSESHIEALKNLIELWPQAGHPERAAEAAEILKKQYGREISVN
ncbi:MAG: tetratricopeptide repeat protein [Thermogutta sp.]